MEDKGEVNTTEIVTLVLLHAIQNGDELCLNLLLTAGADVNLGLMRAVKKGLAKCVNILLKSGADVNATDENNHTALMYAASGGHYRCVDELINAGADVNVFNGSNITPLMCAVQSNHLECAVRLIEAGADVNASLEGSGAALLTAAAYDHSECIKLLLAKGADINKTTQRGHTALKYAAGLGNYKSFQLLIDSGANVDTEVLELAALSGHFKCLKLLKDSGNFTDQSITKCLMERGIIYGKRDYLPCLTEAGVSVNARDTSNFTPLIYAASNRDSKSTRALIEAGADVNVFGSRGFTALHAATFSGDINAVKLLLAAGANVNKKTFDINALTFTVLKHPQEMIELKTILFAAGEVPDHTLVDNCTIPQDKITLKQLCCNVIREHLIKLDSQSNLFCKIPQLGLFPALTAYMLYNVSLDPALNPNDTVRRTEVIFPNKVLTAYRDTATLALSKRRNTMTTTNQTKNQRRIIRFSTDNEDNYLRDTAVKILIFTHGSMLFGVVLTVTSLTPSIIDSGPAIVVVLFAIAFNFLTSKMSLGKCFRSFLLGITSCYGVVLLRLVFRVLPSLQ